MAVRVDLIIVGVLCASLVTGAQGATKNRSQTKVEPPLMRGCTVAVPPLCAGIEAGGRRYVLMNANPAIPVGAGVDVYGTVGGITACVGIPVQVTSWKRNRLKCAAR